jgi:hypothetical protein
MMPVDIQGQFITIDINIKSQTATININIASAAATVNIQFTAQNVGIYLQGDYSPISGTDVEIYGNVNMPAAQIDILTYVVPSGKTLYITDIVLTAYVVLTGAGNGGFQVFSTDQTAATLQPILRKLFPPASVGDGNIAISWRKPKKWVYGQTFYLRAQLLGFPAGWTINFMGSISGYLV